MAACGGQTTGSHDVGPVLVSIAPGTAIVAVGASASFTATVTGAADKAVTWSVREAGGGSVDQTGNYVAPQTPGVFHVVAASHADPSKTAQAEVTVRPSLPAVTISIDPQAASVVARAVVQFTATVGGSSDTAVTFSAPEGGSVTSAGVFTAPDTAGTFRVVATAHADSSKTATATVQVTLPGQVSVSLSPQTFSLEAGASQQLTASVAGTNDTAVLWSIEETGGGAVDANGLYTAPQTPGAFHVVVTSHADPTKSAVAEATVVVPSQPSIAISPQTSTVAPGTAIQFQATVTGLSDPRVTYSADGGNIDATSGAYTAPATSGAFHVTAASVTDPGLQATASVTVVAQGSIAVAISPASAQTTPGGSVQFTATVTGSADTAVTWSIEEGASGGSIDQTGRYTSPANTTGTWHVIATSHADPAKQAVATVTSVAQASITVNIDPSSAQTTPGGSVQFTATVTGTADTSVIWSIAGGCCGSIDQTGRYTSPSTATGTWQVVATSQADSSKQAVASITSSDDLIDHGGPILPDVHVYALWWGPPSDFPSDMKSSTETFFSSLSGSNYLGIVNQYLRGSSASVSFARSITDTSTPPSTIIDMEQALCSELAANGMAPDAKGIYFIYPSTPPPAGTCGSHGTVGCNGTNSVVAVVENPTGSVCDASSALHCNGLTSGTQSLIDSSAHELMESITDPELPHAWMDGAGAEVADKCDWQFSACVQLGSQDWQLQELYSNAAHACVQGE